MTAYEPLTYLAAGIQGYVDLILPRTGLLLRHRDREYEDVEERAN